MRQKAAPKRSGLACASARMRDNRTNPSLSAGVCHVRLSRSASQARLAIADPSLPIAYPCGCAASCSGASSLSPEAPGQAPLLTARTFDFNVKTAGPSALQVFDLFEGEPELVSKVLFLQLHMLWFSSTCLLNAYNSLFYGHSNTLTLPSMTPMIL